jgi:hypothetical protein
MSLTSRRLLLALLQKELRDGRDDPSQLAQRISKVQREIAEEVMRQEIAAKKPKRGRPRKKPIEEPAPEPPQCFAFVNAPDDWSASDGAECFRG